MNNTARKLINIKTPVELALVRNNNKSVDNTSYLSLVNFLGVALIFIQILDGVFTNMGIAEHGIKIEGNPLLQYFMHTYDYSLVLAITKISAIFVIIGICYAAKYVNWIHYAMFTVIGIYLSAAIFPWMHILLN